MLIGMRPSLAGGQTGRCPAGRVTPVDLSRWRKPKRSYSNGACVEVGQGPGIVAVRDSKNPDGPVLRFPGSTWGRLVREIKSAP